jgi:uncharacterized protein YcbK (DUF882 family)
MKLTENFFLQEFKANPSNDHIRNYLLISALVLEPVRAKFGGPIIITSGYRSPEYNKAVGGVPTSQHVKAEACDFVIKNANMESVYEYICNELKWPGQVFFYAKKGHVHVGLPRVGIAPVHKVLEA